MAGYPDMDAISITFFHNPRIIETEWRAFQNECSGHVFQTYDWVSIWLSTAASHQNIRPLIVVCRNSRTSELLAIWPLAIKRFGGFLKIAEKLGGMHADYGGPLLSRKALHQDDFGDQFRPALLSAMESIGVDAINISNVPADVCDFLKLDCDKADDEVGYSTWFRVAGSRDDFFSKISKKVLADTRRQMRRLKDLGELTFIVASEPGTAVRITRAMIEQKSDRYRSTGVLDQFRHQCNQNFYLELATRLSGPAGPIHVSAMLLDGNVIAAHWGAVFGERYYYLMPSYQGDVFSKYSPGKILLEHVIDASFQVGVKIFDFTVGIEGYKEIWGNERSRLVTIRYACSPFGVCVIALIRVGHRFRALLKRSELARSAKKTIFRLISTSKIQS